MRIALRSTLFTLMLMAFVASCGGSDHESYQITRILQQRCQQSAVEDEQCDTEATLRQRLPAILQFTATDQVFLSIADADNDQDLSYAGQQTDQALHFIAQQQRLDPDSNCHFNRIDELHLLLDGDLIEGSQSIRVEQSAACTTTGWSLVTRQDWLWRGHRLELQTASDAASNDQD